MAGQRFSCCLRQQRFGDVAADIYYASAVAWAVSKGITSGTGGNSSSLMRTVDVYKRQAVVSGYDFTQLPDFGETLRQNIHDWFQNEDNWYVWYELRELVHIALPATGGPVPEARDNPFVGKTVVVTGKVEPYNRGEINAKIESLGAHAGSSVSSKTDYLICGENAGSKLDKARQLGIPVLSPAEFFRMADCA